MEPKEKAKELIQEIPCMLFTPDKGWHDDLPTSKECAIIVAESIIKELEQLRKPEYTTFIIEYGDPGITMDGYEKINYWKEVKEEIQKL